jgi:hypothetical protein
MTRPSVSFDDFLGLAGCDFSRDRLIVFHGVSGSGKSTAIEALTTTHSGFRGRELLRLDGPPFPRQIGHSAVIVIDELIVPQDLTIVWLAIRRAGTLIVASHLHPMAFVPFRLFGPISFFATDRDEAKIARALNQRGCESSSEAVRRFVHHFGASYTDLDLILERYPGGTFDQALARFERFCTLKHTPALPRRSVSWI